MLLKILILTLGISITAGRHLPFYRKDYTYVEEFDAFYKLHTDSNGASWSAAFLACEIEGAQLFYPRAPEEWKIVGNLIESKGLANENFTDIYVGIKNDGIEEFITIDGLTTPSPLLNDKQLNGNLCTTMDLENGLLNIELCSNIDSARKPYVCKKVEDVSCPTIDKGYKYVKETKKCYKVNKIEQSWHDALNTCVMEGGLLAIIESEMEAKILRDLLKDNIYYHAGFKKLDMGDEYYNLKDFVVIDAVTQVLEEPKIYGQFNKGVNIRDTYYNFYDDNRNSQDDCGAIIDYSNTIYLQRVICNSMRPFICEMEITS